MSIYNRPYMQAGQPAPGSPFSALKWILITLVAVFLLQVIAQNWFGVAWLNRYLPLSWNGLLSGYVWTPLTYALMHQVHAGLPWHLLGNCLFLWWFGRTIQDRIGGTRFLEAFLGAIVMGGAIWLLVRFVDPSSPSLVGASGGVAGIVTLFFLFNWNTTLGFPFLPITFPGRNLFYVYAGLELVLFLLWELSPNSTTTVAHSAHLGGMGAGFLYFRYLLNQPSLTERWQRMTRKIKPVSTQPPPKGASQSGSTQPKGKFSVNVTDQRALRKEVDAILDKINRDGFSALSAEEKRTLDRAKDILN